MGQLGFSDLDERYRSLDAKKDPLVFLNEVVPWEDFRARLSAVWRKPDEERKNAAGRKPWDEIVIFQTLVLQALYNLSDDQLEYQICDRLSFMRFLGLGLADRVPDAKTVWLYREKLAQAGLVEALFEAFDAHLKSRGYLAMGGQIVDASIVSAPVQRNSREENKAIKDGDPPVAWKPNKTAQKDVDARWTKKHGKSYFGYKNHVNIDRKHKLMRRYTVTDAAVHDSQALDDLLDPHNTASDVWADTAYRSKESEEKLTEKGLRSRIHRRASRGKPLSQRGPCCTVSGRTQWSSPRLRSGDADRLRASQLQHAVQDHDGDVHLGRLTLVRARVQPVADHPFEAADRGLGQRTVIVATGLLPAHAAVLGNELQVLIPLGRRRLGRRARHSRGARRHDDPSTGMALGDAGVDSFLIVRPVARNRGERCRDLVEQGADLGAIIGIVGRQLRRDDPARVGIHPDVQLAPGSASSRAVLLDQPLARAAQLQARAVHQQVHRLGSAVRPRPRHLQGLGPAAQGGMVGNRESETEQAHDRADQAFGLAQRQAEYGLEGQRRRDRQIRVVRLPARRGARLRLPGSDRLVGEPDRQAPALAQGSIILGPVRDLVLLLGNVVAAV